MNSIYLEHNPFTVESTFLVNGTEPAPGCKLSSYKEARLQLWVESLFSEIQALLNGETQLEVEFKGVESDFMDVQDAAAKHVRAAWKLACAGNQCVRLKTVWTRLMR